MEALARRRLHGSAQHAQIADERVEIDHIEVLARRAGQHGESRAPRRHKVADDERVLAVLVDALAVVQAYPIDPLARLLVAVEPDLRTRAVTIGHGIAPGDAMLERVLQN